MNLKELSRAKRTLSLIGTKYGMLTFIGDTGKNRLEGKKKTTRGLYVFKCDCGNIVERTLSSVNSKNTRSCGCLGAATIESTMKLYYGQYVNSAKARNYEFKLSFSEFNNLVKKRCYYCKDPPVERKTKAWQLPLVVNGIDRSDNSKGYILSNVVACCTMCNKLKKTTDPKIFLAHIDKIANKNCGDDYNTKTTYVTEANVGDTSKILLLCIYDLVEKFNLQKAEVMALFKCVLDEHIIEEE